MKIEKIQQAYGKVADLHIELFGTAEKVDAGDLGFIDRNLSDREGKVLDLGCGPGHLTAYLHARAVDVSGIDPVPEFIAHARITHRTSISGSARSPGSATPGCATPGCAATGHAGRGSPGT